MYFMLLGTIIFLCLNGISISHSQTSRSGSATIYQMCLRRTLFSCLSFSAGLALNIGQLCSFVPIYSNVAFADKMTSTSTAREDLITTNRIKAVDIAEDRVLTLSAYLEEMQRNIMLKDWGKVLIYAYTFAEQDGSFVTLINGLFPSNDGLDTATRDALTYEAQEMFFAIDSLQDAAKKKDFPATQRAYTKLLVNYDHFLKAGNLYPTYDPITSTEVFFATTPVESLQFDPQPPQLFDGVLIIGGPDMGKTGTLIFFEDDKKSAVVKLDKNGREYSEVKTVRLKNLGRIRGQPSPQDSLRSQPGNKLKRLS